MARQVCSVCGTTDLDDGMSIAVTDGLGTVVAWDHLCRWCADCEDDPEWGDEVSGPLDTVVTGHGASPIPARIRAKVWKDPDLDRYPWSYTVDAYVAGRDDPIDIDSGSRETQAEALANVLYVLANRDQFDHPQYVHRVNQRDPEYVDPAFYDQVSIPFGTRSEDLPPTIDDNTGYTDRDFI